MKKVRQLLERGRWAKRPGSDEVGNALEAWKSVREHVTPPDREHFLYVPEIVEDQPGFKHVLSLLAADEPFYFCKLNHGFWERLAQLEAAGISRDVITTTPGKKIDRTLNMAGSGWARCGLLSDLLTHLQNLGPPEAGMHFVPSLTPWPLSDRIEGTPLEDRATCESLIGHFVPARHLEHVAHQLYSGHEFKVAAITGSFAVFLKALRDRCLVLIANSQNRALIDKAEFEHVNVIEVQEREAWKSRYAIRDALFHHLERNRGEERPPVVIAGAGGAMTSWLAFESFANTMRTQFVDVGGTLAGYQPQTVLRTNWTKSYQRQLIRTAPSVAGFDSELSAAYAGTVGLRDAELVELASESGVPASTSVGELAAPLPETPIPFIENKVYDFARIADFLSVSISSNHHANGGPVASLLEKAVAKVTRLPQHRRVVAVNNGTSALHAACGLHAYMAARNRLRWVTSAFNFFSSQVGPLADSIVIDCDADGGFDLARLKALPLSSYDGVLYTNIFAQQSDWDDVAVFCRRNGKAFVVDNATGLLDRPGSARQPDAPMEIISAHHTKPWGVGEGGFIICNEDQEQLIRSLLNFGAGLPALAKPMASNWKLSDLAAAAILDRLERMTYWQRFYVMQQRRMHSLIIDADVNVRPLRPRTPIASPRAHTPFVCHHGVDIMAATGPVTLRKYYRPLAAPEGGEPFVNAQGLYSCIFSLSNAPEMRLASNEAIIEQVRAMVAAGEGGEK